MPVDLVIIMLGINDLWADKRRTPLEIGIAALHLVVAMAKSASGAAGTSYPAPEVLLIAPPPLAAAVRDGSFADYFGDRVDESEEPGSIYGRLTAAAGLNAGEVVTVGGVNGVHFTKDNHRALGRAVAQHVKTMLPVDP